MSFELSTVRALASLVGTGEILKQVGLIHQCRIGPFARFLAGGAWPKINEQNPRVEGDPQWVLWSLVLGRMIRGSMVFCGLNGNVLPTDSGFYFILGHIV